MFSQFDRDGSGAIDRAEMKSLLNAFGFQNLSKEDLDAILSKIDKDLSGSVSKEEFIEFMSMQAAMLGKECSRNIFDIIDSDNDGEIDFGEFQHVVHALNPEAKKEDLLRMFKMADADAEGTVSRKEFEAALTSHDCSIWRELGLSLGTVAIIRETVEQYSRLAKTPSAGFGTLKPLPYGKANAKRLGYDISRLPDAVWESACQCANVFTLVPEKGASMKGATVVEFGCGAGADLCVAASMVGSAGKVIGIDMNRPMVTKANQNLATCGFSATSSAHIAIFDGPELPDVLKANSADFLLVNGTLNLSPRKLCALKNATNVLKKGGRLLLADVVLKEGKTATPTGKGAWCDCVAGAVTEEKMVELLTSAGFRDVKLVGFSDYMTSDNTPCAMFTAVSH